MIFVKGSALTLFEARRTWLVSSTALFMVSIKIKDKIYYLPTPNDAQGLYLNQIQTEGKLHKRKQLISCKWALQSEWPVLPLIAHSLRLTVKMDRDKKLLLMLSNVLPSAGLFFCPCFSLCLILFPFCLSFLTPYLKPALVGHCRSSWNGALNTWAKSRIKAFFFFFFGWLMLSKIVPNRVILHKNSPELKDKVGNIVDMKIYLNTFCFKDFSFFVFWYFKQKVLKHFGWVFPMRL